MRGCVKILSCPQRAATKYGDPRPIPYHHHIRVPVKVYVLPLYELRIPYENGEYSVSSGRVENIPTPAEEGIAEYSGEGISFYEFIIIDV